MPVKLNSTGGGSVTLDVGSTASNFTQNLPLATTTLVGTDTTQTLTNKTLTSPAISSPTFSGTPTGVGVLTSDVAKASTSGTTVDFTGIPSWVRRITVIFSGVSTNGSSNTLVQLGDSGGIENTGYTSAAGYLFTTVSTTTSTAGFITWDDSAGDSVNGQMVLCNISGNTWVASSTIQYTSNALSIAAGTKTLSATLDRVRITTVNGTDAFDAGTINILYE